MIHYFLSQGSLPVKTMVINRISIKTRSLIKFGEEPLNEMSETVAEPYSDIPTYIKTYPLLLFFN